MSYTGLYQKSSTYDTCNCSFTHYIHLEAYIFLFIYWYSYINTFKPTFRALELSTGLANTTFAPKEGHLCSRQRTISKGQGGLGGVVNIQDIYFTFILLLYIIQLQGPRPDDTNWGWRKYPLCHLVGDIRGTHTKICKTEHTLRRNNVDHQSFEQKFCYCVQIP